MAKNDRLVRLLNMILVIQTYPGKSTKELSRICGVSERQCFRDLRVLQDSGIPIYHDQGYRVMERFRLKDISFTLDEALALLYGVKLAERQRGLFRVPANLKHKLLSLLPKNLGDEIENIHERLEVSHGQTADYEAKGELFRAINQAIKNNRILRMKYYSFARDELTFREVEPYQLVFSEGFWYLVAYCHQREAVRLFRVDRIEYLEETGAFFELPSGFNYEDYMGSAWGMERGEEFGFSVRFYGDAARFVRETKFHPSQEIIEEDGRTIIFTAKACGLKAITRWLLSFGGEAEVLEPEELKASVRRQAMSILERFNSDEKDSEK
ncbi:MAG: WYL domain-containing protein [Firmicutes bacterium]|nr:WYL domain-containing protein [Bacillota bacterium]